MSNPGNRSWKTHDRHKELHRPPWLEVFKETVELPDGRLIGNFYSVEMQEFVVVAAITATGEVVVENLYRHGAHAMTWSLPAGFVGQGESPLEAAVRELREETGYEAAAWTPLGRFIVDGNHGCGWCSCFLAQGAERIGKPASDDLAETEIAIMPQQRLLDLLAAGGVVELASAAALGLVSLRLGRGGADVD